MVNLNSKAVQDQIRDYLNGEFLLESFTRLGGAPDLDHVVLHLELVRETDDALYVDCAFDFDECVPMSPSGVVHHHHRYGLVHMRLHPASGEVTKAWLR